VKLKIRVIEKELKLFAEVVPSHHFRLGTYAPDQNVPQLGFASKHSLPIREQSKNDRDYFNRLHLIVRDHNFEADHRTQVHLYSVE
jgi:hypothetical protein